MDRSCHQCCLLTFLLAWLVLKLSAYNVVTEHAHVYAGPSESYFGYSVGLHAYAEKHWILAGAPKDNDSLLQETYNINNTGAFYHCDLETSECTQVNVDKTGNALGNLQNEEYSYKDLKDGGWLGVSIDTKSTETENQVVVCAHLWKNQRYRYFYLPNGVCYVLRNDFKEEAQKLLPLVGHRRQIVNPGIYYYAMGQFGTSAHYLKKDDGLVLGAPGVMDWAGTIVFFPATDEQALNNLSSPVIPLPVAPIPEVVYFGYSVASGNFFNENEEDIVIGAPRENSKGTVYIMSKPQKRTNGPPIVKVKKEGTQMCENFGAAVCAVDLNNDGLSDLIVGAPMHATHTNEGRIYVFINDEANILKPLQETIMGDEVANAHFGLAVATVGDLNQDGYNDILVGAPYENEIGAVYIYHGSSAGLNTNYCQRIVASDVHRQLRGFGISFSRGKDVDANLYPDFAVGSYISSHTAFFRTRPVLRLKASIDFDIPQIPINGTKCKMNKQPHICFEVEICFHYTGIHNHNQTAIKFGVELDVLKGEETRGFFYFETRNLTKVNVTTLINRDVTSCFSFNVYVHNSITDYLTPFAFHLRYNLSQQMTSKTFCKDCPMLDPNLPTSGRKQIMFQKNCGEDDKCESDLHLNARIVGYGPTRPFVVGSTTTIYLEVTVDNYGEPAYQSALTLESPSWTYYQRVPSTCNPNIPDANVIICNVGNPLRHPNTYKTNISINVESIPNHLETLEFNISVTTASHEQKEKLVDNFRQVTISLIRIVDITIQGVSSHEQIVYDSKSEVNEKDFTFVHRYQISKYEPSPLESITIHVYVPLGLKLEPINLVKIKSMKVHENSQGKAVFGVCEGASSESGIQFVRKSRLRRETSEKLVSKIQTNHNNIVLNSSTAVFHIIQCQAGNFFDILDSISFEIEMRIDIQAMMQFLDNKRRIETVQFVSTATVQINNGSREIQPPNDRPDLATVTTTLVSKRPPKSRRLNKWIIPVSVAIGCLLLVLMTIGLVKLGFFRRRKRDEMRQLMHAAQLLQDTDHRPFEVDNLIFETGEYD